FAPGGEPFHLMDFFKCLLAKRFLFPVGSLVHLDEPLFGSAENYGVVAPPAVRVAVLVFVVAQKSAALGQQFHDDGIRGEYILALVFGQAFEVDALVVERRVNLQSVFLSGIEIVGAVAASSVNDATALIERAVIGKKDRHIDRHKR